MCTETVYGNVYCLHGYVNSNVSGWLDYYLCVTTRVGGLYVLYVHFSFVCSLRKV